MSKHTSHYEGFGWIKVKRYDPVENPTPADYQKLLKHHEQETTFLISEVRRLARLLDEAEDTP